MGPERTYRIGEGVATCERLLREAERVFSQKGYHTASVSAICRGVGLAHGTFYRYFANKEDVFLRLVERLETEFVGSMEEAAKGESKAVERLLACYETLIRCVEENAAVYNVFREAEFIRPEVARRFYTAIAGVIRRVLETGMRQGELRQLDSEVAAHAVMGMALFLSLRYAIWEPGNVGIPARKAGREIIVRGIDARGDAAAASFSGALERPFPAAPVATALQEGGEATRQALLVSAERLFGESGFYETTIAEITYVAGVALGTFYLYFPSKVAIFNEVTQLVSRRLRHEESASLEGLVDRRAVECVGYRVFFRWVRRHLGAYRILREAEFVDQGIVGREHYHELARAYALGVGRGMERGEIRTDDPEPMTYALLGIAHFSGQRWVLWGEPDASAEAILQPLWEFILHGLVPRSSRSQ